MKNNHYEAIKDIHINLENRNHAIDEYGYGPMNPLDEKGSENFWKEKADLWKNTVEEAKSSRCYNCAAFNQKPEILNQIADSMGPAGEIVTKKANLGYCELFKFKCAGDRTCDAWLMNGPIEEESPANAAGTGNIAGIGVGPKGEPGVPPRSRRKYKDKNAEGQETVTDNISLMRRKTPMMEQTGTFAGNTTFIVPSYIFNEARLQKKKGKHWRTYIGEEDHWKHIREYANKNPNKAIILQDERTGAMCYAKYGRKK